MKPYKILCKFIVTKESLLIQEWHIKLDRKILKIMEKVKPIINHSLIF